LLTAIVTMAPTEEEMREDAALMERIAQLSKTLGENQGRLTVTGLPATGRAPGGARPA
jgi:hypothetical protein